MSEPAKPDPETDALFEVVRQRYGNRLTPEQLDEVRRIVLAQVEAARALRAVRLTNTDEPMQPFTPHREEPPLTLPSPQRGEGDAP